MRHPKACFRSSKAARTTSLGSVNAALERTHEEAYHATGLREQEIDMVPKMVYGATLGVLSLVEMKPWVGPVC